MQKYLWIDAICLNQTDKDEKAQQIPVMGRIYEEARVAHIWLGDNDPMTGKVMAKLRRPTTKLTILELLWNFHEARCLDPKDRIASLFSLISKEHQFHLDYTAQWTELYDHIISGILKNGNNDIRLQVLFHLFEFGAISLPEDTVYPSWVPDWTQFRPREILNELSRVLPVPLYSSSHYLI